MRGVLSGEYRRLEVVRAEGVDKTEVVSNAKRKLTLLREAGFQPKLHVLLIGMSKFFLPNITRAGRIVRAVWGIGLIVGGLLLWKRSAWLCFLLVAFGVFAIYEAFRGWCIMRACGIKTKL